MPIFDREANRATKDQPADSVVLPAGALIDITAALRVGDYKLSLSFSDGAQRVIDFEPFLRSSQSPQIRTYLQPDRFGGFHVEDGDLVWDDYGLCFPIADLYEGRI